MLQLQRASAGSGKTYTLAKKYIWYLIATMRGDHWHLRSRHEIADGLARILAITFTNKATNEMKQRIIVRLEDLAQTKDSDSMTSDEIKKVPYLEEFMANLNLKDHRPIGQAASWALSALLNDYSNFKVFTIDSFFQTILRTFAYEVNLSDAFQIEIDTTFLSAYAVESTLDKVNTSSQRDSSSFWMQELMDRRSQSGKSDWNVFSQSRSRYALVTIIKDAIRKLEKEEYRRVRQSLDSYFSEDASEGDRLIRSYKTLEAEMKREGTDVLEAAKRSAVKLVKEFESAGLDVKTQGVYRLDGQITKILNTTLTQKTLETFKSLTITTTALKKGVKSDSASVITSAAKEMYERWEEVLDFWNSAKWKHWRVYRELVPLFGLMQEARKEISLYLEGANSIHLAETSSILRRVIGDDDAPFVYERIGSTLNHYLIDEFQDTSSLQWDVLRPLVGESLSRNEESLIIGDAKQSIYRFRSADPSLITSAVPAAFPDYKAAGLTREENTNYRSDRVVIEFNNMFFRLLSSRMSSISRGVTDFEDLYMNVSQYSKKRDMNGYVEINFIERSERKKEVRSDDDDDLDSDGDYQSKLLPRLGPLVESMLERGYKQRDIVFLVRSNDQGKAIVKALRTYNAERKRGERTIDFLSEESLLVSSADSVRIIITVLEKLASGVFVTADAQEEKKCFNWNEIKCNFNFYAFRHADESLAARIEGFLNSSDEDDVVGEMIATMQSTSLPALVEAIAEHFVPEELRRGQAVFISAFQDIVLKYCSARGADVASFLVWWKEKGNTESIQSPSGIDAVQIMTIHKSKGLEFGCVIVPFATNSLTPTPSSSEWSWVSPSPLLAGYDLPDVLPVQTTRQLEGTVHEREYAVFHDMTVMDNMNIAYVAFTRAVHELYIFTNEPSQNRASKCAMSVLLRELCSPKDGELETEWDVLDENCLRPSDVERSESGKRLSFGRKFEKIPREETEEHDTRVIEEYGVNSSSGHLQYKEGSDEGGADIGPEAADTDPRSEGNLIHAIMAGVRTGRDIERNAKTLVMRGLLKRDKAREWTAWLSKEIMDERVSDWFAGDWKVLSERSLLIGSSSLIPDRVLVDKNKRRAIIIDYKTGEEPGDNRYNKQVREYMQSFRDATGITNIEGYVWYLRHSKVVKV